MADLKNIKLVAVFTVIFFLLGLVSCNKSDQNTDSKDNADLVDVNKNDFNEKDEDLLSVDYKEFYDQLAPHGEWIEVTEDNIDIELKGTASGESQHRKMSFAEFFGVKDAYADVDVGAFFVWKPSPNLAVGVVTGEPVIYTPYTNGQWVYTDAGWYFRAPTAYEEVVHHHGRWMHSPTIGWVWMPGRVWAPAWVDWRENDTYVAWAPVPPSIYIVNDVIVTPPVIEEQYVVVERRYFVEPTVYKYMYKENKNKIMIKEWRRPAGITVVDHAVVNIGPDINVIQTVIGRDVGVVTVSRTNVFNSISYSGNSWTVYSPDFKKSKVKKNIRTFSKPDKFITYNDVKNKGYGRSGGENYKGRDDRSNDKSKFNENKNKGNNKGNDYQKNKEREIEKRKKGDDSNMKDGGNKNRGNNKGYDKPKGNDKQKGNNKGYDKPKGNDKGKGNKQFRKENKGGDKQNKGNEKQNKSNDKGGKQNKGGDKNKSKGKK
jgi:hypothetical protein